MIDLSGLAALHGLTSAISSAARVETIYDASLDALERGLAVRRASILLFDPDGVMRFKAWRGLSDSYRKAVEGHTPWKPGTQDASIIVVPDITRDEGLAPFLPTIQAEGIAGMAFVPLKGVSGVLGKFMLYFERPRDLDAQEQTLAEAIASQVAFAVQRIRAEHAATERETELRLVTDIAPVYLAHCDRDLRYRFVNAPFAARFGLQPRDVIGRTIPEILGQPAFERVRPYIDDVLSGRPVEFRLDVQYERLGDRLMQVEYAPEQNETGEVIGFVALVVDVTERRKVEEALRQSEALFRELANSLPQIIWTARPDGSTEYFNERWYEFTGFSRDNSTNENWITILHPDDVERAVRTWRDAVRTCTPYEIEYRFFSRASGGYRWQLGRAVPLMNAEGQVVRWVGTCTDIDDQKRSEQASRFLSEASRTLSALTDYPTALQTVAALAVPDFADWCAVDVLEPDGSLRRIALAHWDASKVEDAREFEAKYPSRPRDPYGPRPVMRSGKSELIPEITDEMLAASAYHQEHLEVLRGAGLRSSISVPVKVASQVIGALTFLTSDSGRKYGDHDLALAEELAYRAGIAIENARLYTDLKQADRQKDEFLAVLAHELRNPLAPIRTAMQLIRLSPDDRVRRDRACDVMDRQLQQLIRLVDDLLDVSRITRGKIELRREPEVLASVVQRAVETSRPVIEAAGHELTVTFSPEPIRLNADATRLAQVFSNLLNNAAKYTPRGGRITISVERHGNRAAVRVRDNGVGIPREMLLRIFDMFAQVDRSLEKSSGGLGIGLTLARRLVELHGGTIEARSDGPGTGTEFIVTLPALAASEYLADVDPDVVIGDLARGLPTPRRRVLVVDDNVDAADGLAEILRLGGHEVLTANDGLTALEIAERVEPDVVLLDLGMPRLGGYDTARRLRQRLGSGVIIIATTGWGQEEDRRRSQEAGFDHHLVKPVDPRALAALLGAPLQI